MTAVALLHPGVSPGAIVPFQRACPGLRAVSSLEDGAGDISAAVIFGGDGTVHRYLPGLHARRIPMLVAPVGSGNDFARTLGIRSVAVSLMAWQQFCGGAKNIRHIDLGVIRRLTACSAGLPASAEVREAETLFCCVAGAGLDAETNARANRMPAWLRRRGGYVVAALQALAAGRQAEFTLQADGSEIRRTGWFVAAGNASRYGGGMKIAPRARLDDGVLDICMVGKMGKIKLLCALPSLSFGAHIALREVEYFPARRITVEASRPLEVFADGEPAGRTPIEICLKPQALEVIVPM